MLSFAEGLHMGRGAASASPRQLPLENPSVSISSMPRIDLTREINHLQGMARIILIRCSQHLHSNDRNYRTLDIYSIRVATAMKSASCIVAMRSTYPIRTLIHHSPKPTTRSSMKCARHEYASTPTVRSDRCRHLTTTATSTTSRDTNGFLTVISPALFALT